MIDSRNKGWLIVIALVLVGIFTILLIETTQKTEGEKMGENVSDFVESVRE